MRKQSQLTALLFHVEQVTACYGRGNDTVNDSSERDWQGVPGKVGLLEGGGGNPAGASRATTEHTVQVY